MSAIAFNTLNFTRRLRAARIPAGQAEAFADVLSEDAMVEVATKRDLAELEARLDTRSAALENRIVIKLGAIMAVIAGLLFAALKH